MENRKIIAKEVPPEQQDFRFYFDNDGFSRRGGNINYEIYIPEQRRTGGYNSDEYNEIVRQADCIIDGFDDVEKGYAASYKEVMTDNNIPYSSHKCHLLKQWAKNADTNDSDCVADFLTITRGKKYLSKGFCGYSQGDYCDLIYCKEFYSDESVNEIGHMWLGCGSEFSIDDCYGYYVIDTIRWHEDERLVKYLAELYGCNPEDMEVHLYDGVIKTTKHKQIA